MTTENVPEKINTSSMCFLPSQAEFQMLQVIAKNAQDSGLYSGVGQQAKIFMVLLAAMELGISPMLALNGGIWNIQGKIEISAKLMNALIRRAGHSIITVVSDNKICKLKGKRIDGDSFECSFSIEDAAQAGLSGRDVWKKYTQDMLYNRCMSRLARRLFPDVIGTAYVEGEIREATAVEREQMQMAEFEDVTETQKSKEDKLEEIALDNLSSEQIEELMNSWTKTTPEFKENFLKWISENWKASTLNDIPKKNFKAAMDSILRNLSLNKAVA